MHLNEAQEQAVKYVNGPCFVLAGAGSGKTRVITIKIEYLIKNLGLSPAQILAVTFTNKAATEMKERIEKTIGKEKTDLLTICTFHSLGLEILREEHFHTGLKQNFSLFDQNDQVKVIKEVLRENFPNQFDNSSNKEVFQALELISIFKSKLVRPETRQQTLGIQIFKEYESYLKACNALDFDDLIYKTTLLLQDNETLKEKWSSKFRYILVDEYQDTNTTQYELLKILTAKYLNFTVVGDDDQAIYSWRGANPENIKHLKEDFSNLKVIKLEQNYRSSKRILQCANHLIANNPHIFDKKIFSTLDLGEKINIVKCLDEEDEARFIASCILDRQLCTNCNWKDFAILFRSNAQAQIFEKIFFNSNIPNTVVGGESFFDKAEIKDLLAYLRFLANQNDEISLMRIINIPRRGIGKETLTKLTNFSKEYGKSSFVCAQHPKFLESLAPAQQKAILEFINLINELQDLSSYTHSTFLVDNIINKIKYEDYLKNNTLSEKAIKYKISNVKTLLKWLDDLMKGREGQKALNFKEAVAKLSLRDTMSRNNQDEAVNAVQLMTLHASKGLEFPHVFLVGLEEGTLPHKNCFEIKNGIEEERRLAYVGITRAQQTLTITYRLAKRLTRENVPYGPLDSKEVAFTAIKNPLTRSRFLDELPLSDVYFSSSRTTVIKSDQEKTSMAKNAHAMLLDLVGSAAFEK